MRKFFIVFNFFSKWNVTLAWRVCCCDGICLLSFSTLCSLFSPQPSITCVGDGMLFPASISSGESRGCKPKGHSWFTGCSGDRLQLLSSSHDELPSDVFWNCKSWREGVGWRREKRDWQMKTWTHLPTWASVFLPDAGKLLRLPPLLSVCVCVFLCMSVLAASVHPSKRQPSFYHLRSQVLSHVDSSLPSKHSELCQWTRAQKSARVNKV